MKPDARNEDRGRHARRRWRELFDNFLPVIVAAIVAILAVLAVLSVAVFNNARNASEAAKKARQAAKIARVAVIRQQLTSQNGCERVQLLRDDTNVIAWGVYNALDMTRSPDARRVADLLAAVDPSTRRLIVTLLAGGEQSRPVLKRVRDLQAYLPPTDCKSASLDPKYRFPRKIPWREVLDCYDPVHNERPMPPCRR